MQKSIEIVFKSVVFLAISILIVSCLPKEEKPPCCEDLDTVRIMEIDTSLLHNTPYFQNSRRFVYADSAGNISTFLFNEENTEMFFYKVKYMGVCTCNENYLQRNTELYEGAHNELYSTFHLSKEFDLLVHFQKTDPYNFYLDIDYEQANATKASFTFQLDDYNADLAEIVINDTVFYNVKLGMRDGDTLMVANLTQGVVAFKDENRKWWTLDSIEDVQ